ncbi:MAG: PQQ-binding-like beta-propeller repeat protein [Actinomycetota bacterium]|nr:PQQ-binding-like beta-propeller repeat protein [Actinomycetota bacterium]
MAGLWHGRLARPSWPALVWVGVAVLALVAATLLAARSDSGNTDVRTAAEDPTSEAPLPGQLRQLWTSAAEVDDQLAVASDTVITSSPRGIRGLDPQTGEERWHYLRSSATMCDLTVLDDVVVAIFRTTGRCNEAVALEAGTGLRRWYRNVGFSERLQMLGSGTAAVATTPTGLAVLDAVGNSLLWRYNPPVGCELSSIAVGNTGVVALERCETGTTWLAQFDLYGGQPKWRVAPPTGEVTVLGADGVVSLLAGQQLMILSSRNGVVQSTLTADAGGPGSTMFAGQPGGRAVPLVHVGGRLYAIDPSSGQTLWTVAATGAPALSDFGLVVPEDGAFVSRNALSGAELARSTIPAGAVPEGLSRIERTGASLIAVTEDGVIGYG